MTGRYPRRFGKYVLLKPLAKGGMGEIYLAAGGDVGGFEKLCVIKKVITEKADRTKANRFLDEAKVVLRLSHAALVNTFDAGEVDGEFYIAMELVEGKDLREVWNRCVRTRQRIPLDVALHVVREVARALAYVHGYGDLKLVHRDVAPPNILLAYVGDVKLTDFGLARSVLKQEHTAPGVVFGRAAYLAPEQARGEIADARTDIYTLGIVLWELLTGQQFLQLSGLDPAAALAIVRHPKLLPPSAKAPWITPALDEVVMRALAPDRTKRYQSAEEFRQGLSEVMADIAPRADAARVSEFLHTIYTETIAEERGERERYLKDEIPRFRAHSSNGGANATPPGGTPATSASAVVETDVTADQAVPAPAEPEKGSDEARAKPARVLVHLPNGSAATAEASARPRDVASLADLAKAAEEAGVVVRGRARGARSGPAPAKVALPGTSSRGLAPGAAVGPYRVMRLLHETAGVALYEAEHEDRPGRVALRLLPMSRSTPPAPAAVSTWQADAARATGLGNPHIVQVHEVGLAPDGRPFAALEPLAGIDLASQFARTHRLEPSMALRVMFQLCQALGAAHAAGVIHGALWPACVFLASRGEGVDLARLMDFGATALYFGESGDPSGGLTALPPGLIECLAPELTAIDPALGRPASPDVRTDVYGLGAILYEMLTGAPPFTASREGLERKQLAPPQSPRFFRPDIPEALDRLILAMLDRDPARRPPTVADVQSALSRLPPPRDPDEPSRDSGRAQSSSPEARAGSERRRVLREAAFRVVSELAAEPAPRLPAALDPGLSLMGQAPVVPASLPAAKVEPAPPVVSPPQAPLAATTGETPVLGGAMLARYGVGPAGDGRAQRSKKMRRVIFVGLALVAGAAIVAQLMSSAPAKPPPGQSGK